MKSAATERNEHMRRDEQRRKQDNREIMYLYTTNEIPVQSFPTSLTPLTQSQQPSFRLIEITAIVECLRINVGTVHIVIRVRNLHTNRWDIINFELMLISPLNAARECRPIILSLL
ncbi:hypothetical protein FRC03_002940 [Tulasnella sp. 419]|nr:hypothetical protein FRC03_002940 [Tulasnella sp. 419]